MIAFISFFVGNDAVLIASNNDDHTINGMNSMLTSCTELQEINVTGP